MPEFNMGNLEQWEQISCGELVEFTVPEAGFRAVRFDVIADGHVSIRVITDDQFWIVGTGVGRIGVRFGMDRNFAVAVDGDKDTSIFIRTGRELSVIPESVSASHATIEPRGVHIDAGLKRMMHLVKINSDRREAMLKAEIDRLAGMVHNRPPAAPPAAGKPAQPIEQAPREAGEPDAD